MLFNRNDKITNEKTIYQTKPNMLLGCKKAIFGVILLVVVLSVASPIITFIGEMQVYLISYVKLSLTRYTAIALFVIILFIILYIIWQLINWYYMEYILTDSRIIIKSGVLYTKKNYMPYGTIQEGADADFVIFDPDETWIPTEYASKSSNSPFTGEELTGKVKYTICGGNIVYSDIK